jgi:hypothetical protein
MPKKNTPAQTVALSPMVAEVQSLTASKVMAEAVENLTLTEQVQAHILLKRVNDAVDTRLKLLRDPLLTVAIAKGEVISEKGTKKYVVDGSAITVEYRRSSVPDENKVKELLQTKNVPITEVFDEVKTLVFNPSKLDFLVQVGKVTKAEVEALIPEPSPAMRVVPSKELKEITEAISSKKG